MNAKSLHNADDSFLGYLYQGQYALLLLQAAPPGSSVSVETDDDVVLEGETPTLIQLKHSSAAHPPALTVKNVGWWKTLAIWISHARQDVAALLFVTCAHIQQGSALEVLRPRTAGMPSDLGDLADSLLHEAERVKRERAEAQARGGAATLPHAEKASGCAAVLGIGRDALLLLLAKVTIVDGAVPATGIEQEVIHNLRQTLPLKVCEPVARRLLEWWDRQITQTLLKTREQNIQHEEYTNKLHALIQAHGDDQLPDDYSSLQPSAEELGGELKTVMERQIELVGGGPSRLHRAARERWRARHQRHRWLEDDISIGPILDAYDERLKEAWSDQHSPMTDDTSGQDDNGKRAGGLRLLEWAHHRAPEQVAPPRSTWPHPFLARGQLQELAEDRQVGWHPDYLAELEKLDGEGEA